MPAFVLANGPTRIGRFDVVGAYAEGARNFVRHVGLYNAETREVSDEDEVEVAHMGPPFATDERMKARCVGSVPLSNNEATEVECWFEEVEDEYNRERAEKRWQQFVIDPPWKDVTDGMTAVRRFRRYSCAGFVLDAHSQVNIELIAWEDGLLPEIGPESVKAAYPNDRFWSQSIIREEFGLRGYGPWRIVLAGYVLHSLARSTDEIRANPYRPKPGDERF